MIPKSGNQFSEKIMLNETRDPVKVPTEPLLWPVVTKPQPGIGSFAGHTNTVLDVVGRIGTPPSLAIFSEGNHLMALLSDDIVGAFPAWARSQPAYADLDLSNIVVVTLPQSVLVQMITAGGLALGNPRSTSAASPVSTLTSSWVIPAHCANCISSGWSSRRRVSSRKIAGSHCWSRKVTRLVLPASTTCCAQARESHYRSRAMFASSAERPQTSSSASRPPTSCLQRRYRVFQDASASCIAIFPKCSLAVMRTWPSPGITSFHTGREYSRITSRARRGGGKVFCQDRFWSGDRSAAPPNSPGLRRVLFQPGKRGLSQI
jgi:hypothetical protein